MRVCVLLAAGCWLLATGASCYVSNYLGLAVCPYEDNHVGLAACPYEDNQVGLAVRVCVCVCVCACAGVCLCVGAHTQRRFVTLVVPCGCSWS